MASEMDDWVDGLFCWCAPHRKAQRDAAEPDDEGAGPPEPRTTVLIIEPDAIEPDADRDDSPRNMPRDAGYDVLVAANPTEAIDHLRGAAPLVVLVDAPHLIVARAAAWDRRLARRHAYVLVCAHDETCPADCAHLFARLQLVVLQGPFNTRELLRTVARAGRSVARPGT
jgi:hypothetical protein